MIRPMRKLLYLAWALVLTPAFVPAEEPPAMDAWPNLISAPTEVDRATIIKMGWPDARDALAAAIAKNYQPGEDTRPGSAGKPSFQSWLLLWQWCDLLARDEQAEAQRFIAPHLYVLASNAADANADTPANTPKPILAGPGVTPPKTYVVAPPDLDKMVLTAANINSILKSLAPADSPAPQSQPLSALVPDDILARWTNDEDFLRSFFATLSPWDFTPAVLRDLVAIQQAQPAKFHEYRALAIALAVVYDEKPPAYWPHRQVLHNLVPFEDEPVADRFAFWVKSNETGDLLTNLRMLTPEQLKFVVDAPVDESELRWAQKNVLYPRSDFTRAFFDVAYSHLRATENKLTWDTGDYTLANIKRTGGICVDQAYYAAVAGKARGLPTLYFEGLGSDGGHAWFGYLKDASQWALDCGRYANQNYVTGAALDPQTWTAVNDHELAYRTDAFHDLPQYAESRDDLAVANLFDAQEDIAREAKALDSAIAICPRSADAWDAKTAFLERTGAPLADLRAHHEAAVREFASMPDLKAAHQSALAALASQQGDDKTAAALQRSIAAQNESTRTDLTISVEAEKITGLIKARDLAGATKEFQIDAPELGRIAGSTLFYKIAQPLVNALLNAGNRVQARSVLDLTRSILTPMKNGPLDQDLSALQQTANSTAILFPDQPK
jgi:hypothetical protein